MEEHTWNGGNVRKTLLPWYIRSKLSDPGGGSSDIIFMFLAAVS